MIFVYLNDEKQKPKEPKWIPVDERVPDETSLYLVTVEDREEYVSPYMALWDDVEQEWELPLFEPYDAFGRDWRDLGTVIAWAEMPKPFEGEEDDQTD